MSILFESHQDPPTLLRTRSVLDQHRKLCKNCTSIFAFTRIPPSTFLALDLGIPDAIRKSESLKLLIVAVFGYTMRICAVDNPSV